MDNATVLQLQADIAQIKADVTNIKQALELGPAILARIEDQVTATNKRAEHVIEQNDVLVRWATDDSSDASWPVALAGLTAVSDRLAKVEQAITVLPGVEAALASVAGQLTEYNRLFVEHDRHVAERVERAAQLPTREVQRLRPYVFVATALSLLVVLIHIAQAYQAGALVAIFGG